MAQTFEGKAKETFVAHYVKQSGGQNRATYKQPGLIECRRHYTNRADESWLQLVPGHDFSRSKNHPRNANRSGQTMTLQFEDIQIHDSYPWSGAHVDWVG